MKMARAVSSRQRDRGRIIRREHSFLVIKFPNKNFIETQLGVQNKFPGWKGLNHVSVSSIVSAEGEAPRLNVRSLGGACLSRIFLDVAGDGQRAVGQNGQHRDGAAEIIRDEQEFSGWMNADVGRTRAARTNSVE